MRTLPHKLLLLLLCIPGFAWTQKPYFQQEVNYTIKVVLDDTKHTLTGNISFEYINNSPDQLGEIWVHLWPNAYKNRRSAFCHQQLRQGDGAFYFAKDSDLGSIKDLDFTANGVKANWKFDPKNPDIARIELSTPLASGGKVTIASPFTVRIPASFSRLGHVETSYQITQWYPKPAVYDQHGWHAMPYLNQGEFYSEFGSFDVEITLPDNYVVGATGTLQTASEWDFLAKKEKETRTALANFEEPAKTDKKKKDKTEEADDPYPASSGTMKTLRYKAEKVHDFAWFADKRFFVVRDTARLASGRTVDCWGMFNKSDFKIWQKGAFYVKRAIEFYSNNVGEYPWPQATAVHSALSAGGGMEYPMITVIGDADSGKSLDEVITHEVGHNWFYGLLASNERDFPWMDEGMNTYYEFRYMRTYYGNNSITDGVPKMIFNPEKHGDALAASVILFARIGEDTPGSTNSDHMTNSAYGLQAYMKTAYSLRWLELAIGTEKFDAAMKNYYQKWHFKHPQPEDFNQSMTQSGIDMNWFMEQMETRKHHDAALKNARTDKNGNTILTVRQKGKNKAPFSVTALKDGQEQSTKWFLPTAGQTQYDFGAAKDADAFVINYHDVALDLNTANNDLKTSGFLKKNGGVSVKMLQLVENKNKRSLGVMPWAGWNNDDKTMLGLLLYNPLLPGQKIQYYLAPGFAAGSKEFVGGGDVRWRIHPTDGPIKRITLGVNGRTFNDNELGTAERRYLSRYYRVSPNAKVEFRSSNTAHRHSVGVNYHYIGLENGYNLDGVKEADLITPIWETEYKFSNLGLPNPVDISLRLEGQNWDDNGTSQNYLRLGLEWKQRFYYTSKRKVTARVYGGYFIANTNRDRKSIGFDGNDFIARGTLSLAQNGYTDYKREFLYLNRNGSSGLASRQVPLAEGGFKYAFGTPFASTGQVGHSNNYLVALNLGADLPKRLPFGLPLKPYFDLGYADLGYLPAGGTEPSNIFWSGGFELSLLRGLFSIYFPAVNSDNINRTYKETSGGNYLRRITWSIRMDGLEPLDFADKFLR